jgi:hypothetical protein
MSVYESIEQEYLFGLKHMTPANESQACQNLLEGILSKYRGSPLSRAKEINILLYFNSIGSLNGLAEWAEAADDKNIRRVT